MWNRASLKERGRAALRRNYWKCIIAAFIVMLLTGSFNSGRNSSQQEQPALYSSNQYVDDTDLTEEFSSEDGVYTDASGTKYYFNDSTPFSENPRFRTPSRITFSIAGFFLPFLNMGRSFLVGLLPLVAGVAIAASILLSIFVFSLFEVGGAKFFVANAGQPAQVRELLCGFTNGHYGNTVLTLFLRSLFTFLWSLLLIVPGIIKHYEYCMIPYLLADHPELSHDEAFAISKSMMDGNKMDVFVLDLSFIGWQILSGLTFGILGIFYVNPYIYATKAELYLALKRD
ncbi:MAG: DUF975 family protein [Eubacterium sp.]